MTPEIYLVKVESPLDETTFDCLLKDVRPEKKNRILKQKSKQNADNMLIGEALAKVLVKKHFDIDISRHIIACNKHGKPYLKDFPHVHFNISHSGEYVVCVVSDKPVGVDIQKIVRYNPDVAKKICDKKELMQIDASSDKESEFTKLWTQKEAVLKMLGTGIAGGDIKNCLEVHNAQSKKIENYWISKAERE